MINKSIPMTRFLVFIFLLLAELSTFGQAPDLVSFQALARDSSQNILINSLLLVRFSIHNNSVNGPTVYQEEHSTTTNGFGQFSLNLGGGVSSTGSFDSINWGQGAKYLQIEIRKSTNEPFINLGGEQLLSVPYALYAKNTELPPGTQGGLLYWNGSAWVSIGTGTTNQILTWCNGQPQWGPCQLNIGDPFEGGVIGYILQPEDPGYNPQQTHGIIAAPFDQSIGAPWGCFNQLLGYYDTNIGAGFVNTKGIIRLCNTAGIAAYICDTLTLNGYTDWFLPTYDELNKLYLNKNLIGGFSNDFYWTSSEFNINNTYGQDFGTGVQSSQGKYALLKVRAIRYF